MDISMTPGAGPVTWCQLVIICILCTLSMGRIQATNDNLVLTDGLLVMPGETMRSHMATWTVIVTVDRPAPEGELGARLSRLQDLIRSLRNQTGYQATTSLWEGRLRELEDTLVSEHSEHRTRHRRAPLEFIGDLQSWLFGTPSRDEMDNLQRTVAHNRDATNRITHVTNQLLTIVNQTQASQGDVH